MRQTLATVFTFSVTRCCVADLRPIRCTELASMEANSERPAFGERLRGATVRFVSNAA